MKLDQIESDLKLARDAFESKVKEPNTIERNIALAGHRSEIARLQKLMMKDR